MIRNLNVNPNLGADPSEFPRVAKEMGFKFSLKRGRVDWHKIDVIDIDRLVQERDLITLKDNFMNIMNYNLENEYDVKILDSSFVKLFKLAQLSIDYLMYSEQHLFNCVELIREEYAVCMKDNEKLKRTIHNKDNVAKSLKKKIKDLNKLKVHRSASHSQNFSKCIHCSKTFVSAWYLEAHCLRRHADISNKLPQPTHVPFSSDLNSQEISSLHKEIQHLKTLLMHSDQANKENIPNNGSTAIRNFTSGTQTIPEAEGESGLRTTEWEQKYMENISAVRSICQQDIKTLKEMLDSKEQEIAELREQLHQVQHLLRNSLQEQQKRRQEEQLFKDLLENRSLPTDSLLSQNEILSTDSTQALARSLALEAAALRSPRQRLRTPSASHALGPTPTPVPPTPSPPHLNPSPASVPATVSSQPIASTLAPSTTPSSVTTLTQPPAPSPTSNPTAALPPTSLPSSLPVPARLSVPKPRPRLSAPTAPTAWSHSSSVMVQEEVDSQEEADAPPAPSPPPSDSPSLSSSTNASATDSSDVPTPSPPPALAPPPAPSSHDATDAPTLLRQQVEALGEQQLRSLGVDPAWERLPSASFNLAAQRLQHMRHLQQKGYIVGLAKLRESLKRTVEVAATKRLSGDAQFSYNPNAAADHEDEASDKPASSSNTQMRPAALDRVVGNVRRKAQALYAATGSQIRKFASHIDISSHEREMKATSPRENEKISQEPEEFAGYQTQLKKAIEGRKFSKSNLFVSSHPIPSQQFFPPKPQQTQYSPAKLQQSREILEKPVASETSLPPARTISGIAKFARSDPGLNRISGNDSLFPSSTDEGTSSSSPDGSAEPSPASQTAISPVRSSLKQAPSSTNLSKKKVIFAEKNMEYSLEADDSDSHSSNTPIAAQTKHVSGAISEKSSHPVRRLQSADSESSEDWDEPGLDNVGSRLSTAKESGQGDSIMDELEQILLPDEKVGNGGQQNLLISKKGNKSVTGKNSNAPFSGRKTESSSAISLSTAGTSVSLQDQDLDTWDLEDFDAR